MVQGYLPHFAELQKARTRRYRSRFLQPTTLVISHSAAFFETDKIRITPNLTPSQVAPRLAGEAVTAAVSWTAWEEGWVGSGVAREKNERSVES